MIPVSAQISSLPGRILPRMTEMLVTCPPTLEFVNPAENSLIAANDSLAFDWTPGIPYDHAMRIAGGAMIGQFACYTQAEGNEVTSAGHGDRFVSLNSGHTSQAIEVDDCRPTAVRNVRSRSGEAQGNRSVRHIDDPPRLPGYLGQQVDLGIHVAAGDHHAKKVGFFRSVNDAAVVKLNRCRRH